MTTYGGKRSSTKQNCYPNEEREHLMKIVYVGDRKPSNRALLISNEEWKRLGRILTKKTDEEVATQAGKRLKHLRREMSKKMVDGWDNTELSKTKKLLEQKQKAISELETRRLQRDEEMKREAQAARDEIIKRVCKLKFEERDETKTFNRAIQHSEMVRERAIQLKFNETEREKKIKEAFDTARKQNEEAERYRKEWTDRKRQNNELKRANAETLLKELKEREDKRRNEQIASHESGKAELRKILEEIEEDRRKSVARAQAAKDKLQKDMAHNREVIARNDEMRRTEEWEDEMVTTIMAETKKILAGMRRQREIELADAKWLTTEAMTARVTDWPKRETGWVESDVRNAVETQERRYWQGRRERAEQAERRAEYEEDGVRLRDEAAIMRRERSAREREREAARREREKALLTEFAELRRRKRMEDAAEFRARLDAQRTDKAAALAKDRRADMDRHEAFKQLCREQDEQFVTYAVNVIEQKKTTDAPIIPLLKTVSDYLKKNDLCLDRYNKVLQRTAKGPIYTSRIIRLVN